jgi:hypothetical protein
MKINLKSSKSERKRLKKKKDKKKGKEEEESSTAFTIYINGQGINKIKQIKVSKDINQI